jgi:hypothetical protein
MAPRGTALALVLAALNARTATSTLLAPALAEPPSAAATRASTSPSTVIALEIPLGLSFNEQILAYAAQGLANRNSSLVWY